MLDLAHFALMERFFRSATREAWARQKSIKATGIMLKKGLSGIIQTFCGLCLKKLVVKQLGSSNQELTATTACFSTLTALEEFTIEAGSTVLCDERSRRSFSHLLSAAFIISSLFGITKKGIQSLAPIISLFVLLRSVDFSFNLLWADGVVSLCSALTQLPDLECLYLVVCSIEDRGFSSLTVLLKSLPHLTVLSV